MNKKQFISFSIVILMVVLFVLNSCSKPLETQTTTTNTEIENVTTNKDVVTPVDEIPYIFTLDEKGWKEYGIPSSFDLRSVDVDNDGIGDRCFVTKVKLQNPYGTCWAFAALAASEISILGSVYLDEPDAYKSLDLSEKQFTHFLHIPITDEDNSQYGEGLYPTDDSNKSLYSGGYSYYAISLFSQGIGLSDENKEGNEPLIYRGANGYTEQRYFNGEFRNYSYSDEDDWSIPEEYRFKFDYILKYALTLPSPNQRTEDDEYSYNPEATEAIKLQLLQRRGVTIDLYADTASPDADNDSPPIYLNPYTWSHYTWEKNYPNHSVTIVGWDDNYPKENFISDHQPSENGAWLIKNSWGSGEEEFPNKGSADWGIKVPLKDSNGNIMKDENGDPIMTGSGYFWLSYYDMSLYEPTVYMFEKKTEDNDYLINQTNYLPFDEYSYEDDENEIKSANIFKADIPQILNEISYVAPINNLNVHYEVYLLSDNYENPEDGLLVTSGDYSHDYTGLYRVKIDKQVTIQQNQYFSIVLTMQDEDGIYYTPEVSSYRNFDEKLKETVVNSGESFYYENESWNDLKDYSDELLKYAIEDGWTWTYIIDNYPIKAFSYPLNDKMNIKLVDISEKEWKLYLNEKNNTSIIKIRFEGISTMEMGNPKIIWGFAEEDQNVVSVEELKNGTQIRLTALNPGVVHLTVTVNGIGTTVKTIVVEEYKISEVEIYDITYNEENLDADIYIYCNDGNTILSEDLYTLVFSNNTKCGIGKVEIIPNGIKFEEELPGVYYYQIKPTVPELEAIFIVDGQLKGNFYDLSEIGVIGYGIAYRKTSEHDWNYEILDTTEFIISVDKNSDYEFSCYSICCVDNDEMDQALKEELYDEEDGRYYIYSDWSENIIVEK